MKLLFSDDEAVPLRPLLLSDETGYRHGPEEEEDEEDKEGEDKEDEEKEEEEEEEEEDTISSDGVQSTTVTQRHQLAETP